MPNDDRQEARIQSVTDSIRRAIAGPQSEDDVGQIVEAAMGDEFVVDPDDEPPAELPPSGRR